MPILLQTDVEGVPAYFPSKVHMCVVVTYNWNHITVNVMKEVSGEVTVVKMRVFAAFNDKPTNANSAQEP